MAEDATPLIEALLAIIDAARAYLPGEIDKDAFSRRLRLCPPRLTIPQKPKPREPQQQHRPSRRLRNDEDGEVKRQGVRGVQSNLRPQVVGRANGESADRLIQGVVAPVEFAAVNAEGIKVLEAAIMTFKSAGGSPVTWLKTKRNDCQISLPGKGPTIAAGLPNITWPLSVIS